MVFYNLRKQKKQHSEKKKRRTKRKRKMRKRRRRMRRRKRMRRRRRRRMRWTGRGGSAVWYPARSSDQTWRNRHGSSRRSARGFLNNLFFVYVFF
jgi:hypothetical protein